MQVKGGVKFLVGGALLSVLVHYSTAQTITSNSGGTQGDYHYEYWKDNGTGTMILGEACNFSCNWGQVNNILFRKGVRPGSRKQVVTYSADYKPTGNSYLSIYGWFKNPLVEYYIIESWGTWKPPGAASKGTIESDSGTYDIYETTRNNQPSIEGTKTFQQYWSVRRTKRTSGTINCSNHFDAWENKGMKIGSMYEVSFNVEAYQSGGGEADVKASMSLATGINSTSGSSRTAMIAAGSRGINIPGQVKVSVGGTQTISFTTPVNGYASVKVYNYRGQEVASLGGKEYSAGQHSVTFPSSNLISGVYYYAVKTGR